MAAAAQKIEAVHTVLRVTDVWPNPDQPRKDFPAEHIESLWLSIEEEGLLQPISVTPRPGPNGERFMIIAGECRWRAHGFGGAEHIECLVQPEMDDQTIAVLAIVENARRRDVTPLEEAVAFQGCLDRGMTEAELAKRLGISQVWRIQERTCLLNLRPEYQTLLKGKQLTAMQAYEMALLSPGGQDNLFRLIRAGECPDLASLRAKAMDIRDAERQVDFFGAHDKPTEAEKRLAKGLEARFASAVKVLRASTVDNEVVAVRKVSPDRAAYLADLAREMQRELDRVEKALRSGVAQMELAAND